MQILKGSCLKFGTIIPFFKGHHVTNFLYINANQNKVTAIVIVQCKSKGEVAIWIYKLGRQQSKLRPIPQCQTGLQTKSGDLCTGLVIRSAACNILIFCSISHSFSKFVYICSTYLWNEAPSYTSLPCNSKGEWPWSKTRVMIWIGSPPVEMRFKPMTSSASFREHYPRTDWETHIQTHRICLVNLIANRPFPVRNIN